MIKNKRLNFDLDSLDENSKEFELERKKLNNLASVKQIKKRTGFSRGKKTGAVILIIVAILGFTAWLLTGYSESGSSTNSAKVSDYHCSGNDQNTADSMQPSTNEKKYLDTETDRLNTVSSQLDRLKSQIDSSTVTEYSSQYLIDYYNQNVNTYNTNLAKYQTDFVNYNSRRDAYNKRVDSYNSFLDTHCR